jgi:uncharacterized membrane protein YccC
MLILVGLLLSIVATLVNGLLSYQELMSVANVKDAMATLHVDQAAFTYARSVLVVLVAILVALFCRSRKGEGNPALEEAKAIIAQAEVEAAAILDRATQDAKAMTKRSPRTKISEATNPNMQAMAITEQAESIDRSLNSVAHSPKTVAREKATQDVQDQGYVAIDDGATMAVANGNGQAMIATGGHRERIKRVMLQAMRDGKEMSYGEIAEEAGTGYSTVKKWAPTIREELAQ